jgi:hypothetical protein
MVVMNLSPFLHSSSSSITTEMKSSASVTPAKHVATFRVILSHCRPLSGARVRNGHGQLPEDLLRHDADDTIGPFIDQARTLLRAYTDGSYDPSSTSISTSSSSSSSSVPKPVQRSSKAVASTCDRISSDNNGLTMPQAVRHLPPKQQQQH